MPTKKPKKPRKYTCNACGERKESHHGIAGKNYCDDCCFICSGCYKAHTLDDCHKVGDNKFCNECYKVRYRTCEDCGEVVSIYDARCGPNGNDYCTSCFDDRYTVCNGCGNFIKKSDAIESDGGSDYCQSCYESRFTHCEDCDEEVQRRDCYHDDDGNDYCQDCWTSNHTVCTECEEHSDHLIEQNGGYYCPACHANIFAQCAHCNRLFRREELISQAGRLVCGRCKRRYAEWQPTAIDDCDDASNGWKYGIELETSECSDSDELYNNTVFGCHCDGSIHGMEYISPIMSGERGNTEIDKLCEFAKEHSWTVNDDHTSNRACGYHIHLDMRGLRMTELHRIIAAYYLTEKLWRKFVSKERADNRYCRPVGWKPEKFTEITTLDSFKRAVGNIQTYWHGQEVCGRYCWFNLQAYTKHTSFEIRLHGGTLDATEIKNWVAIHTKFLTWIADHTMEEINSIFSGKDEQTQFSALMAICDDAELSTYYAGKTELEFIPDTQLQFSEVE